MRRARALLLAAALAFGLAPSAFAAPTVTAIASLISPASGTAGVGTVVLTTTAACNVGDYIYVAVSIDSTTTPLTANSTSVLDSGGHTYFVLSTASGSSSRIRAAFTRVTTAMPSGSTITLTVNETNVAKSLAAACASGLTASALDLNPIGTSGASATTFSFTTGTPAQADELALGFFQWRGGFADVPAITAPAAAAVTVMGASSLVIAYQVITSAAPITITGTNSVARAPAAQFTTFKVAVSSGARQQMPLLGVGN
jgi:hypothetical protein